MRWKLGVGNGLRVGQVSCLRIPWHPADSLGPLRIWPKFWGKTNGSMFQMKKRNLFLGFYYFIIHQYSLCLLCSIHLRSAKISWSFPWMQSQNDPPKKAHFSHNFLILPIIHHLSDSPRDKLNHFRIFWASRWERQAPRPTMGGSYPSTPTRWSGMAAEGSTSAKKLCPSLLCLKTWCWAAGETCEAVIFKAERSRCGIRQEKYQSLKLHVVFKIKSGWEQDIEDD